MYMFQFKNIIHVYMLYIILKIDVCGEENSHTIFIQFERHSPML